MPTEVTAERVESVIFDGLAEVGAERDEIKRESTLEDLEVDSLDLVELAQIIDDEFGIDLDGEDVKDLRTVGEVIDLVVARGA